MMKRREEVIGNLQQLQVKAEKVVNFLSDPALVKQLRSDKSYNLNLLSSEHGVGAEDVDALFHYAKFQFDCGNYSAAAEFLLHYRSLCTNGERGSAALWGKFASDILQQDWNAAQEDMTRLKDAVENRQYPSPLAQTRARTWLLHWSLFVFFNHENGRNAIIDVFFQERHAEHPGGAPHLPVSRRGGDREQAPAVDAEGPRADPAERDVLGPDHGLSHRAVRGVRLRRRAGEARGVRGGFGEDFFLVGCKEEFGENARLCIFGDVLQDPPVHRHQRPRDEARDGPRQRGAVDREPHQEHEAQREDRQRKGTVVMAADAPSIHDVVVEKTKALTSKTYSLAHAVLSNTQALGTL